MSTVKIQLICEGQRFFREVEGIPASFAGFNDYQFILHRDPGFYNGWRVSEATTGFWFAEGRTPNEARHNAKVKLNKAGLKGIREAMKKAKTLMDNTPLKTGLDA